MEQLKGVAQNLRGPARQQLEALERRVSDEVSKAALQKKLAEGSDPTPPSKQQ